jgi:Cysteine-rich CWC
MTASIISPPRRLACARCGADFDCSLGGGCWCAEEPYRLPLPESGGGDCLCPECLRRLAAAQKTPAPPVT